MEISIDQPSLRFGHHLSLEANSRILFSGKFGIGKSYFLKNFFNENNDYNIFWISPINYVIGANQDIFEWIKVDIARELLENYLVPSEAKEFSKNLIIQTHIFNNVGAIFSRLIKEFSIQAVSTIIKDLTGFEAAKALEKEINEYKSFEEKALSSEYKQIEHYINAATQLKGSIYEDDLMTRILRGCLELVKAKEPTKKNILVIDDLDRLDPEHIFRILNILSAHNDHFQSNKFGFDSVIVVCDIENVEKLYRHRYGDEADFEGYIEKFYSVEPFNYALKDAIISYCENNNIVKSLSEDNKILLRILFIAFFKNGFLKIRNLKKIMLNNFSFSTLNSTTRVIHVDVESIHHIERHITRTNEFELGLNYDVFKVLYILRIAFGGVEKLRSALKDLETVRSLFDFKYMEPIVSATAIITHIANNINKKQNNLFFSLRELGSNFYEQTHPNGNFFGLSYSIKLKWDNKNKYTHGDYFEDAKLISLKSLLKENENLHRYSLLAKELLVILNFVIKERIFIDTE